MFSEIINTICVLVSVSLLFLGATTHKCVKQVEEKINLIINELDSDSESDSESYSESESEYSYSESYSESESEYSYSNFLEFEPFIEKSSSLPDIKDYKIKKRSMSF